MRLPSILENRLKVQSDLGLSRKLELPSGVDFTSNDYLGFAADPELRLAFQKALADETHFSSSGSRLLRGHLPIFEKVERALAAFSGQSAALFFPSGYQANLALFSALLKPGDLVFSDSLNHASIVDGIKLSRADKVIYPHGDLDRLKQALSASIDSANIGLRVIVSESLFSMDGDHAPLAELVALAEKYDALLVIDEAHATGLYGSGLVEHQRLSARVLATTHTAGKALGASGAWIASSAEFRDYLIQFARPFIYSTAPAPAQAVLLLEALKHWGKVGASRAQHLFSQFSEFNNVLRTRLAKFAHIQVPLVPGPILPVIIGDTVRTVRIAAQLREQGLDVRAIRPPTVPVRQDRLRITLHATQSATERTRLVEAMVDAFESEAKWA